MTMALVLGTNNSEFLDAFDGVTNGNDVIWGFDGIDSIWGLGGDDWLAGGDDADSLFGGTGRDTASYVDSTAAVTVNLETGLGVGGYAEGDVLVDFENIDGSDYGDTLTGDDGSNELFGDDGDDTLKGGGGADTLSGWDDDDTLKGGGGADVLDGGDGIDTADYSDSDEGVFVNMRVGSGYGSGGDAEGDELWNIENLAGSVYDDILWGSSGANELRGQDGDDELNGFDGDDSLRGGADNDWLQGWDGADVLDGGSGIDTAVYETSDQAVFVSLLADTAAGGDAAGDELNSIENLTGSAHADRLSGDNNFNVIRGEDGNNWLYGYGGDDGLVGGDDTDVLFGMEGADLLKGGGGADTLLGGVGGDTMLGSDGDDTYFVDDSADIVTESAGEGTLDRVKTSTTYSLAAGSEVEVLETAIPAGTTAIDLVGNEFDNTIIGNDGQNTIVGSPDTDGGGYDGLDTMTGFGGGDVFVWSSTAETGVAGAEADVVTDFNRAAGDLLAFNPIDADGNAGNGDTAFTFIGVSDGSFDAPGQISYFTADGNGDSVDDTTYILLNTDADATQEATIRLNGAHTVDASWFVL
jgi:Ca2+-binding RTX toxin-like protein